MLNYTQSHTGEFIGFIGFIGSNGLIGLIAVMAAHRERREGTGQWGKKRMRKSGKMIESSGDTGMVWRKFEGREKRGSNPKTSKAVKNKQKTKQYQEAKMVISLPAPGISWLRDVF